MLQKQAVSAECLQIVRLLMEIPALEIFRLVGGTALALQTGHRISVDIDLFASQDFDNARIVETLEAYLYPERPQNVRTFPFGFFCDIYEIKTDFMFWGDAFIEAPLVVEDIRMAGPLEIFAMKLHAIRTRKVKKDFIDLAVLLQTIPLEKALKAYETKYPYSDVTGVLKHLSSSHEADNDTAPVMLIDMSWQQAKESVTKAIKKYWNDEIG